MKEALWFYAGCFSVILALWFTAPGYHTGKGEEGYYSYPEQRKDKRNCESTLPRDKICILSSVWLPEAE